ILEILMIGTIDMDEQKVLILIDQVDKTSDINNYAIFEDSVQIQFRKSKKLYNYSSSRVFINSYPTYVDIEKQKVLHRELPLRNVRNVMNFKEWLKVFFEDQQTRIYSPVQISIVPEESESNLVIDP